MLIALTNHIILLTEKQNKQKKIKNWTSSFQGYPTLSFFVELFLVLESGAQPSIFDNDTTLNDEVSFIMKLIENLRSSLTLTRLGKSAFWYLNYNRVKNFPESLFQETDIFKET